MYLYINSKITYICRYIIFIMSCITRSWFMLSYGDDPKSSLCHAMFWKKAHEVQQQPSSFQSLGREGRANMQLLKSVKFEKNLWPFDLKLKFRAFHGRLARLVPVLCPEALLELTNFGKVASATCCDRKRCEEQSRSGRIWGSLGMPATGWTLKCGGYAEVYQRDTLQNKCVCRPCDSGSFHCETVTSCTTLTTRTVAHLSGQLNVLNWLGHFLRLGKVEVHIGWPHTFDISSCHLFSNLFTCNKFAMTFKHSDIHLKL